MQDVMRMLFLFKKNYTLHAAFWTGRRELETKCGVRINVPSFTTDIPGNLISLSSKMNIHLSPAVYQVLHSFTSGDEKILCFCGTWSIVHELPRLGRLGKNKLEQEIRGKNTYTYSNIDWIFFSKGYDFWLLSFYCISSRVFTVSWNSDTGDLHIIKIRTSYKCKHQKLLDTCKSSINITTRFLVSQIDCLFPHQSGQEFLVTSAFQTWHLTLFSVIPIS